MEIRVEIFSIPNLFSSLAFTVKILWCTLI